METLKDLLINKEHNKILQLPSPEFDSYKAVAAIHLEKYEEALVFADKNTFETAYAYYKLKNYKKALKIIRKLEGKPAEVLASQCLYFLGQFSNAFHILEKHGDSDEYAVNLLAMKSLNHLNVKYQNRPSLFTVGDDTPIEHKLKFTFKDPECLIESEFNRVYRSIENTDEYLEMMARMSTIHRVENSCFLKQIAVLKGNNSNVRLTTKEMEVYKFNLGLGTISNPVLFQRNFISDIKTEYRIFTEIMEKPDGEFEIFQPCTSRLRLLKGYFIAKRRQTPERKQKILKTVSACKESLAKEILELLGSDLSTAESQRRGQAILKEFCEKR